MEHGAVETNVRHLLEPWGFKIIKAFLLYWSIQIHFSVCWMDVSFLFGNCTALLLFHIWTIWHCNSICAIWFLALQLLYLRQTKYKSRQNARLSYSVWGTCTCPGQRWSCMWTPFAKAHSSIWRQQTHRGSRPSFYFHIPVEIQKPPFLTTLKSHPLLLGGENLSNDLPHCTMCIL